jgi:DNA mismatch endonuclease (patch repair protein)
MGMVKSKNTIPEMLVRTALFSLGYRFRLHKKELPGKPDIVLPKYKKAIFVNGCFWHGHSGCKASKRPQSNSNFWNAKLNRNIARDKEIYEQLKQMGWQSIIVWECQLSTTMDVNKKLLKNLLSA